MASMMDGFAAIFHVILGKFISGRGPSPKDKTTPLTCLINVIIAVHNLAHYSVWK